jgi:hypothetical protein
MRPLPANNLMTDLCVYIYSANEMSGMWPGLGPKKIRWGAPGRRTWLQSPTAQAQAAAVGVRSCRCRLSKRGSPVACGACGLWPFFLFGQQQSPGGGGARNAQFRVPVSVGWVCLGLEVGCSKVVRVVYGVVPGWAATPRASCTQGPRFCHSMQGSHSPALSL